MTNEIMAISEILANYWPYVLMTTFVSLLFTVLSFKVRAPGDAMVIVLILMIILGVCAPEFAGVFVIIPMIALILRLMTDRLQEKDRQGELTIADQQKEIDKLKLELADLKRSYGAKSAATSGSEPHDSASDGDR